MTQIRINRTEHLGNEKGRMTDRKTVVLVSHPSITHDTLIGMLASFSCLEVVSSAGALSTFDLLARVSPQTVVIDANLPHEETLALLRYIKRDWPHIVCIVLATTSKQHSELRTAGADILLSNNCTSRQLQAAVCDS